MLNNMSSLSVGTIFLLLAIVSASSHPVVQDVGLTGASHPMIVARRNGVKKRLPHGESVLAFWYFPFEPRHKRVTLQNKEQRHEKNMRNRIYLYCIHECHLQTWLHNAPSCLFKAVMLGDLWSVVQTTKSSKAMHIWQSRSINNSYPLVN